MKRIKLIVRFAYSPETNASLIRSLASSLASVEYGIRYAVPSLTYRVSRNGQVLTISMSYAVPFGVVHKIDQFFYSLSKLRAVFIEINLQALLNNAKVSCSVNGKRLTLRRFLFFQREELNLLALSKQVSSTEKN